MIDTCKHIEWIILGETSEFIWFNCKCCQTTKVELKEKG